MLQANGRLLLFPCAGVQIGSSKARIMGDTGRLSLNELPQKRELQMVRHDIRRSLNLALLHE